MQRSTPWTEDQLERVQDIVSESALMLDTHSSSATSARWPRPRNVGASPADPDGIAQELAGLAYVMDDIAARE